jgi:NAD(P)H-dependent flavin oxidoreductase YrpB (nitropropane dioxygenase family)
MTAASAVHSSARSGDRALPLVIQGGMGVAVSSWRLASAIARAGQLGVVSGTALDLVLARRLQDGDSDGAVRRALAAFPVPEVAERIVTRYYRPGGRPPGR